MTQTVKHPVDMNALAARYTIQDAEAVRRLLEERPFVLPLLMEAPAHVESLFGAGTSLRLEIFQDREESGPSELHVLILTGMGSEAEWEEADRRLYRLHEEWLITLPRPLTAHFDFFVEPR